MERSSLTSNKPLGLVKPTAKDLSSTITALKSTPDRARAELIRDVVDAFRRLYGSVQRFVLMFADLQGEPAFTSALRDASFNRLLSVLAEQGKTAAFSRLSELKVAIKEARSAERLRDAIFSDAYSDNPAPLRGVAAELERLDATFVGLCVEHVLEQRARAALVLHTAD
ncbi:MAG: hypothetical protein WCA85_26990 [Paraburkholderia sp.]|uniref:hypothetical protein n=1 Tax=Paraburkholderia sp. TaxID=1926495 RepID=UPI003C4AA052